MKLATNQGLNGRSGLDDGEMYGAETLDLLTRRFTHIHIPAGRARPRSQFN